MPPKPPRLVEADDEKVMTRLRVGDNTAIDAWVSLYQDRLYATMARMTGNDDDAADLVQETFVRALANLEKFQGHSSIYTWLYRIAVNLALTELRNRRRHATVSLDDGQDEPFDGQATDLKRQFAQTTEPDPATAAADRMEYQRVMEALARLSPEAQAILILRDVDGMDYREISEILRLAEGTMKSRLFRARNALREAIGEHERAPAG